MGFFRGLGKAAGHVVNVRVDKWIGLENLKDTFNLTARQAKEITTPEQTDTEETFEEAKARLNLTDEDLAGQVQAFSRNVIILLMAAAAIFLYSIYIAVIGGNLLGFLIGTVVSIYATVLAFRYHFWIFQIKHKKLGCTLNEWWNGALNDNSEDNS